MGVVAGLLSHGREAFAIVHDEWVRTKPAESGFSASVDGSLALSDGTIRYVDVAGGVRVSYETVRAPAPVPAGDAAPAARTSQAPFDAVAAAANAHYSDYGRYYDDDRAIYAQRAYGYLRWTRMWNDMLGTDVFAQLELNRLMLLEQRSIAGGGLRLVAISTPRWRVHCASSYLLEYEEIGRPPSEAAQGINDRHQELEVLSHRWNSSLTVQLAFVPRKAVLQNTVYVQPRFDKLDDLRLLGVTELLLNVTDSVSFSLVAQVHHDSDPPFNVPHTDRRLSNKLTVSF